MNKCNSPQFNEIKMPLMCVGIKELISVVIERSPESHMTRSLCCSVGVGPQETEKDIVWRPSASSAAAAVSPGNQDRTDLILKGEKQEVVS